ESLTNIERHSNATQVNFDMSCTSKQVCFTISDNGVGYNFKANESEQGIGLKNMRERVELLGGEFKIHGVIGKGCQVQVSLPLLTTPRRTLNG
ncbi:MAG: ATP-binding protein, partial [Gammaproteobacteria bacterium]|nr:ATP-binding protein [Gammaproteobacteria bacterium]